MVFFTCSSSSSICLRSRLARRRSCMSRMACACILESLKRSIKARAGGVGVGRLRGWF